MKADRSAVFTVLVIILVLATGAIARAEYFPMPRITDNELRRFKVRRRLPSGRKTFFLRPEERISSYSVMSMWKMINSKRYFFVERKDIKVGGHTRTWKFFFEAEKNFKFEKYEQVEKTPDGKILGREFGSPWNPDEEIPENTVHAFATSEAIRGFKFKEGAKWPFYNWNPQTEELHRIILNVEGIESIELPAGHYRAWKTSMDIDLEQMLGKWRGLEFFIKRFIPKFTIWFADTPYSPMIKFRGNFGSGKSAFVEHYDLVEMKYKKE